MGVFSLGLSTMLSQLLLLLCFSLFVSGEVTCESSGTCLESSSRCQCDPLSNCYDVMSNDHYYASYVPGTRDGLIVSAGRSGRSCEKKIGWTSANRTNISLESLTLRYVSISPKYFAVCVSWSLSESSGSNGGFVVESKNLVSGYETIGARYCITDSTVREMCINNYRYERIHRQTSVINVYPFPLASDDNTNAYKESQSIRNNMAGCADADSSVGTCGPRFYEAPTNLSALSRICDEDSKDLIISWLPPPGAVEIPSVYFVSVYDIVTRRPWKHFRITNSSQITLRNLSVNVNYSVNVRAYGECTGLGDYYTAIPYSCGTNQLGCGYAATRIVEKSVNCLTTTFSPPAHTENVTSSLEGTSRAGAGSSTHIVTISVVVVGVCILVIALVFLAVAACSFKWHSIKTSVHPTPPEKKPLFVFYSPSMCESRLKSLQEHVVCLLLEYFEVVTPDSISSGNISMWLEDTVKSVDSILMVANKEFCCDWNRSKEERSPVMNSLELLISSAAAQNSIGKFCFISPEDCLQDVFVPDHSYLKLMPVFLLGKKKCDIDKLYQFVTKSRGIEFTTDT